jgi:hypothetical protein
MDPMLLFVREDLARRLAAVAGTMVETAAFLTAAQEVAGDVPGTEVLRAAAEDLRSTGDDLRDQARAITAAKPVPVQSSGAR